MARLPFVLFLFFLSCHSPKEKEGNAEDRKENVQASYRVEWDGAMKQIMMEGDISATVELIELEGERGLYALGALEALQGEILILDGTPLIATVEADSLRIDRSFEHRATLLVHTKVSEWRSFRIEEEVPDMEALEEHLVKRAEEAGLDLEKPFPFLIEGEVGSLDWHVIDWEKGDSVHTHHKHRHSGLQGNLEKKKVQLLGFFSRDHQGVFTHHSSSVHIHCWAEEDGIAAHVDGLSGLEGMNLKLPGSDDQGNASP